MSTPKATPPQIRDQLRNWRLCFWIWNMLHYALGLTATVGAVFLAKGGDGYLLLKLAVPVATAALTFLNAKEKANIYIAAWRHLNAERIKYELTPEYDEARLANSHGKAEELISTVN